MWHQWKQRQLPFTVVVMRWLLVTGVVRILRQNRLFRVGCVVMTGEVLWCCPPVETWLPFINTCPQEGLHLIRLNLAPTAVLSTMSTDPLAAGRTSMSRGRSVCCIVWWWCMVVWFRFIMVVVPFSNCQDSTPKQFKRLHHACGTWQFVYICWTLRFQHIVLCSHGNTCDRTWCEHDSTTEF